MLRKSYRLLQKTYFGAAKHAFATDMYARSLVPAAPCTFASIIANTWEGDAKRGVEMSAYVRQANPDQLRGLLDPRQADQLDAAFHGFGILYDLRSVATDEAAYAAAQLVITWARVHPKWHATTWAPAMLAARLLAWVGCYPFYAVAMTSDEQGLVAASTTAQLRHIKNTLASIDDPMLGLKSACALVRAGAALHTDHAMIEAGLKAIEQHLLALIVADGGPLSRRIDALPVILHDVLDARSALMGANIPVPSFLAHAVDRMVPAVRFFMHGDGKLAVFHGVAEGHADELAHLIDMAGAIGRAPASMPYTGFEHMVQGDLKLIIDTGAPQMPGAHHHSLGAFEFSCEADRIIVNCGQHVRDQMWRDLLSATAAHSALTLDGQDNVVSGQTCTVDVARRDLDHGQLVQVTHDGYYTRNGYHHTRRVFMPSDGAGVQGEDHISTAIPPVIPNEYTIRFHLHPRVAAAMTGGADQVLLRASSGAGWRFTAEGMDRLRLEDSVYLGATGLPQKTKQIVVSGQIYGATAMVKWALTRV